MSSKDVPRIEGLPDPRDLGVSQKGSDIDPDKFKKVLKVDESDETEKRNKRQRTKQQEEEDVESEKSDDTTPRTVFSDLMKDPKTGETIFDSKEGTKADLTPMSEEEYTTPSPSRITSPETPTPTPISMMGDSQKTPTEDTQVKGKEKKKIDKKEALETPLTKKETEKASLPKKEKVPLAEKLPETKTAKKKISTKPPPHVETEKKIQAKEPITAKDATPTPTLDEKQIEKGAGEQVVLPQVPEEKKGTITPKQQVHLDTIEKEKKAVKASQQTEGEIQKERKKEEDKESEQTTQVTSDISGQAAPTPIAQTEMPSYSQLPPEVFALFERMVGLMTLEQFKGVSTTTIELKMPNSVFNGAKIILDHYDTAPGAFNLKLEGKPKAVALFTANLSELASAFQGAKLAFQVNIRSPTLSEEHRHQIRRKEHADQNGQGRQQK